jgi:hypothetical protein
LEELKFKEFSWWTTYNGNEHSNFRCGNFGDDADKSLGRLRRCTLNSFHKPHSVDIPIFPCSIFGKRRCPGLHQRVGSWSGMYLSRRAKMTLQQHCLHESASCIVSDSELHTVERVQGIVS